MKSQPPGVVGCRSPKPGVPWLMATSLQLASVIMWPLPVYLFSYKDTSHCLGPTLTLVDIA